MDSKTKKDVYAQLPRSSIQQFAESASYTNLESDVLAMLAEDSNYWLREAIKNATQFMIHSRRKKMTVSDFNKACRDSNIEPFYGYNDETPLKFSKRKKKYFLVDETVEFDFKSIVVKEGTLSPYCELKGTWLPIGGIKSPEESPSCKSIASALKGMKLTEPPISETLWNYLRVVTAAILGSEKHLVCLAFKSLKVEKNISRLLPYLAEMVSLGLEKMSHDPIHLKKFLQLIRCLNSNPSLFLGHKSILSTFENSLLDCVTKPLTASMNPFFDQWIVRDSAAYILALLLNDWLSPTDEIYCAILKKLESIFCDLNQPFYSHYGVVAVALSLGVSAIETVILPHLSMYFRNLNRALQSSTNAQIKLQYASKVHAILLIACEKLLRAHLQQFEASEAWHGANFQSPFQEESELHVFNPPSEAGTSENENAVDMVCEDSSKPENLSQNQHTGKEQKSVLQMYHEFYEQYGDVLAQRLPLLSSKYPPNFKDGAPLVQLFSCPELKMKDEELLERFQSIEKAKQKKTVSVSQETKSDSRFFSNAMHLKVKSVKGTKLTITKTRLSEKSADLPQPKKADVKSQKEPGPLFETVPLLEQNPSIVFRFSGATPKLRLKLHCNLLPVVNGVDSDVYKISKTLNKIGKIKSGVKHSPIHKSAHSGNLYVML